jgi:hypothetical protein
VYGRANAEALGFVPEVVHGCCGLLPACVFGTPSGLGTRALAALPTRTTEES